MKKLPSLLLELVMCASLTAYGGADDASSAVSGNGGDFDALAETLRQPGSVIVILAFLALWIASRQRKLAVMDETVDNAMAQIGVQLSSRFDVLTTLLDLTKGYAVCESQTMIEVIKSRRSAITASSTPEDVLRQENVISETLGRISMVAEQYPELKVNENYVRCMNTVEGYERMVRISRRIYNDRVTELNRELRMFPASVLARVLGFRRRDYLEVMDGKIEMPGMR